MNPPKIGIYTASLTPFSASYEPEIPLLISHVKWLLENGADGVALLGSTGEANSMTFEQRKSIIEQSAKKLPLERLLIGTGSCALQDAIELTKVSIDEGVYPSVMASNVAGLGSKAVQELTEIAGEGNMSTGIMGDMMEVGLVNQGTMAAMGEKGMEDLTGAMGMEGGDMGLAAMTGGMIGMGTIDIDKNIDSEMAENMGIVIVGEEGVKLRDVMPTGGPVSMEGDIGIEEDDTVGMDTIEYEARMDLGQASAAMGIGISADEALGPAMELTGDAAALAEAAIGSAISAQGVAAAAIGSSAMSAATGIGSMGEGAMGEAMDSAMQKGMTGTMGNAMAGAMAAGAGQEGYAVNNQSMGEGAISETMDNTNNDAQQLSGAMKNMEESMGGMQEGMNQAVSEATENMSEVVSEATENISEAVSEATQATGDQAVGAGQEGYNTNNQAIGVGQEGLNSN